jgi:hydroxyacylglutathione hydrolase
MFLKEYHEGCEAPSSYLIGDERTATAIVVNPHQDIAPYLADAQNHGWTIRHVFLTQRQPYHGTAYQQLRERTGALIHRSARVRGAKGFIPHADGDSLTLGSVRLCVMEPPNGCADAINLLVFDLERDPEQPCALLGSDTRYQGCQTTNPRL